MNQNIHDLFNLSGKVAVITGGSGWLGSAMSQALAEAGAHVVILDINNDAITTLIDSFKKEKLSVTGMCIDVMQDKPLRASIDKVAADLDRLDILINCAYAGPIPLLDDVRFEDIDKGLHNGPGAYCIAAQQAAKHMRVVGGGSIINIGSMYGMVTGYPDVYEGLTSPSSIVYQAGKAAIIHMTRYMAVYWAKDNIRVNCISPGPFLQRDIPERMPEFARRIAEKVPMRRYGQSYEMKGVVVFLASAASSFMTGQNIVIDGGWTSW
ncbi:MAG: SDR family oxidoreductase [Kiritimatiellae bacterium]|nr:SDR family oxidoreductase [Kiritimatiellia bacterium]MDD5519250.1 SDR family oxidoreductase [Kiritimatiellia bacterium]